MDRRAIGVFDSGLGGLTAVKRLRELAPQEDIVFFGDTARVPYGNRTPETISAYAQQDISFLLAHDVKMVVAACGTVSSALPADIIARVPVPYVSVVQPAALAAAAATRNKKVGVIGTVVTVQSGSFVRALAAADPAIAVVQNACPLFVPLVEAGYTGRDCDITLMAAQEYLAPLQEAGVDTVILGCTHYPLLADIIADIMGDAVLVDSGFETAKQALAQLQVSDSLNDSGGRAAFYTSDNPDGFTPLAELFLGGDLQDAVHYAPLDDISLSPVFEGAQ